MLNIRPDDKVGKKLAEKLGKELPKKLRGKVIEQSWDCPWARMRCFYVSFHVSGDRRAIADDIKKVVDKIVKEEKISAEVFISEEAF